MTPGTPLSPGLPFGVPAGTMMVQPRAGIQGAVPALNQTFAWGSSSSGGAVPRADSQPRQAGRAGPNQHTSQSPAGTPRRSPAPNGQAWRGGPVLEPVAQSGNAQFSRPGHPVAVGAASPLAAQEGFATPGVAQHGALAINEPVAGLSPMGAQQSPSYQRLLEDSSREVYEAAAAKAGSSPAAAPLSHTGSAAAPMERRGTLRMRSTDPSAAVGGQLQVPNLQDVVSKLTAKALREYRQKSASPSPGPRSGSRRSTSNGPAGAMPMS